MKQPGKTKDMEPKPQDHMEGYLPSGKLSGKVALVTGGDSGIGRATSIAFAKEGADVAIVYLSEDEDAEETARAIRAAGQQAVLIRTDIRQQENCEDAVTEAIRAFGRLDILVNNAGEQHPEESVADIDDETMRRTFETNIFSMFYFVQAALPHLKQGSAVINTASVTAYKGHDTLLDYAATKGAIVAFTRSLAEHLAPKGIRVNGVAPGPIWTPLIPSTFPSEKVKAFGENTFLKRPGQPDEVAPCFVFLASTQDSSYMTGQFLHPNGGTPVES